MGLFTAIETFKVDVKQLANLIHNPILKPKPNPEM